MTAEKSGNVPPARRVQGKVSEPTARAVAAVNKPLVSIEGFPGRILCRRAVFWFPEGIVCNASVENVQRPLSGVPICRFLKTFPRQTGERNRVAGRSSLSRLLCFAVERNGHLRRTVPRQDARSADSADAREADKASAVNTHRGLLDESVRVFCCIWNVVVRKGNRAATDEKMKIASEAA